MSTMNPYLQQYKKNQVETATPEQILILLYDGAINYLNKAKVALEQSDVDVFNKNILGCKNILLEFMNSLDMENGGQVALTLHSLYRYYHTILIKTEMSQTPEGIEEVLRHLTNLRETWMKAIDIANAEKEANLIDKYEGSESKYDYNDDDDDDDEDEDEDE